MVLHQAYPPEITKPMREYLVRVGVEEIINSEQAVDAINRDDKPVLVLINSVCGCAAKNARPAMKLFMDRYADLVFSYTVFAGVHHEAVAALREHIPHPPSSPSFALFHKGVCKAFLGRDLTEGREASVVLSDLHQAVSQLIF